MMKTNNPTPTYLSPLLATAILTACGGGGGTSTGSASPTAISYYGTCGASSTVSQAAAQALCVPVSVPIVTSIPATTYAAGSQEKLAFDYLNNARSTCGFGLLAQDTKLDTAAANHTEYQILNNARNHSEIQGLPGFTGLNSQARAAYVGYVGQTSEAATQTPNAPTTTSSVDSVRWLLAAPYHFRGLMDSWRDVGFNQNLSSAPTIQTINIGVLSTAAKQQPGTGTVLTYPCQGTTDTAPFVDQETPWPWPGHGGFGQSVLVQVAEGSTLVINTSSITRFGGPGIDAGTAANGSVAGASTAIRKLDWSNDTNNHFTGRYNVAMLMPDKIMMGGGVYRVQITGTVDGAAFSKDFTFTTKGRTEYEACLVNTAANMRANAPTYAWPAQYLSDQLATVPGYCAGFTAGNTVPVTAATIAQTNMF